MKNREGKGESIKREITGSVISLEIIGIVCDIMKSMRHKNYDLSNLLAPYKKGWVALNEQETEVLAHADTFAAINDKIKGYNPGEVILFPLGHTQSYFVGFVYG